MIGAYASDYFDNRVYGMWLAELPGQPAIGTQRIRLTLDEAAPGKGEGER